MNKELKAFIFDLDGVITDTAEYHYLAWKQLSSELGIEFTRADNERLKGISRMESLEIILEIGNKQSSYTVEEKEKLAAQKNEHYMELIKQITPNDILPGIKQLLLDIKAAGYKLGLASVSKNAPAVMNSLQLSDQFDYMVDAHTIKRGKPDPEIFLKAAEKLGVLANECIGIEDAEAGVEAIKSAGMFAVGVGPKEQLAKADLLYSNTSYLSLDELIKEYQS